MYSRIGKNILIILNSSQFKYIIYLHSQNNFHAYEKFYLSIYNNVCVSFASKCSDTNEPTRNL